MSENPHIAGRYAVFAALIGVMGTISAVFLTSNLNGRATEQLGVVPSYDFPGSGGSGADTATLNSVELERKAEAEIKKTCLDFISYWEDKDLENMKLILHSSFYYTDQVTPKQNRAAYLAEKTELFIRNNWPIEIGREDFKIIFNSSDFKEGTFSYYQHYNTPTYKSRGRNTFYFVKIGDRYKIKKEKFEKE